MKKYIMEGSVSMNNVIIFKAKKITIGETTYMVSLRIEKGNIDHLTGAVYGDRKLVKVDWMNNQFNPTLNNDYIPVNVVKDFVNARLMAEC